MAPWRLGSDYDRPIPRRILEEAGIPRQLFGTRKKAVVETYNFPKNRALRRQFFAYARRQLGVLGGGGFIRLYQAVNGLVFPAFRAYHLVRQRLTGVEPPDTPAALIWTRFNFPHLLFTWAAGALSERLASGPSSPRDRRWTGCSRSPRTTRSGSRIRCLACSPQSTARSTRRTRATSPTSRRSGWDWRATGARWRHRPARYGSPTSAIWSGMGRGCATSPSPHRPATFRPSPAIVGSSSRHCNGWPRTWRPRIGAVPTRCWERYPRGTTPPRSPRWRGTRVSRMPSRLTALPGVSPTAVPRSPRPWAFASRWCRTTRGA